MLSSLQGNVPDPHLVNLSVRNIVPHKTWIEVLAIANPEWILYQIALPNLREAEWEDCFTRRFLPGWKKWKKEGRWRPTFLASVAGQLCGHGFSLTSPLFQNAVSRDTSPKDALYRG